MTESDPPLPPPAQPSPEPAREVPPDTPDRPVRPLTASDVVARLLADPRLHLRLAADLPRPPATDLARRPAADLPRAPAADLPRPPATDLPRPPSGHSGLSFVAEPRPPVPLGLPSSADAPLGQPPNAARRSCQSVLIPAFDAADRMLRSLEYVVVDVETTGGGVRAGHRITEFAAIRVTYDGSLLDEYTTLINPERPIPPFVSALTNISWEMVRDAPRFADVASNIARILDGGVFVAHNAAFDWRFVSHELEWASGQRPQLPRLCTVRLARKVVPEVASRSLDALTYYFGLVNLSRHRAYGDAHVTAQLLTRMLARVEEREIVSWNALDEVLGRRKPRKSRRRQAMPSGMDTADIPAQ